MRPFNHDFNSPDLLPKVQQGVMKYRYKDKMCLKSPFDIATYLRLLHELKPKTIIEIGSKAGGSALLLKDFAGLFQMNPKIISIDINRVDDPTITGIEFLKGDVSQLEDVLDDAFFEQAKGPILVIEDSSHMYRDVLSCLEFFAKHLRKGDMLVIEDGVLVDLGLTDKYEGGPNRAIEEFFASRPDVFELATEYCDVYGRNITYSPNGYLWKR